MYLFQRVRTGDKWFLGLDAIRDRSTQSRGFFACKSQSRGAGCTNIDRAGGVCDRERGREAVGVVRATHSDIIESIIGWACSLPVIAFPMGLPKIPSSIVPIKEGR